MDLIEKKISHLIETQFPQYYRENGQVFVAFLTEYYKWMESVTPQLDYFISETRFLVKVEENQPYVYGNNTTFSEYFQPGDRIALCKGPGQGDYDYFTISSVDSDTQITLTDDKVPNWTSNGYSCRHGTVIDKGNSSYYSRRFAEIKDIDATFDEFVKYFKSKYLVDIQFNTLTDTRRLVKHSLDLYRSKGTERSLDLLYKAVFGKPVKMYYPGQDIFRLSSGQWFVPQYLELSLTTDSAALINKQVVGVTSGATAYVEEIVRTKSGSRIIDIAFISNPSGNFITGEKIVTQDLTVGVDSAPTMVGSLSDVLIDPNGTGSDFNINDVVDLRSENGTKAKGKVLTVVSQTGQISFVLVDGGYGYTSNADVYVSEKVVRVRDVRIDALYDEAEYTRFLQGFIQPLASINYLAANGAFNVHDEIYTYHANNDLKGTGRILDISASAANSGTLLVSILSGNMDSTSIATAANAVHANVDVLNGYNDETVYANAIGTYANVTLDVSNTTGAFTNGEFITQPGTGAEGYVRTYINAGNNAGAVLLTNVIGVFFDGYQIEGANSGVQADVDSQTIELGVVNVNGSFIATQNNFVYTTGNTGFTGSIENISLGTGANAAVSSNLLFTEFFEYDDTTIAPSLPEALNDNSWATLNGANLQSIIIDGWSFVNVQIGKISGIISSSPGEEYNKPPIVRIYEPVTYKFRRPDLYVMDITNPTQRFNTGDLVTQSATNARGLVKSGNTTQVTIQTLRMYDNNQFIVTSNSTTVLVNANTGGQANIVTVAENSASLRRGLNATFTANVAVANGALTSLKILDSGYGFTPNETVTITSNTANGVGAAVLSGHGHGTGYYKDRNGFLSDTKKLSDGYYYQEYSYEVRSAVIDDFKDKLKDVVHLAGTKYFDALVYDTINTTEIDANTQLTIT